MEPTMSEVVAASETTKSQDKPKRPRRPSEPDPVTEAARDRGRALKAMEKINEQKVRALARVAEWDLELAEWQTALDSANAAIKAATGEQGSGA
jgi:hypothetical protein